VQECSVSFISFALNFLANLNSTSETLMKNNTSEKLFQICRSRGIQKHTFIIEYFNVTIVAYFSLEKKKIPSTVLSYMSLETY